MCGKTKHGARVSSIPLYVAGGRSWKPKTSPWNNLVPYLGWVADEPIEGKAQSSRLVVRDFPSAQVRNEFIPRGKVLIPVVMLAMVFPRTEGHRRENHEETEPDQERRAFDLRRWRSMVHCRYEYDTRHMRTGIETSEVPSSQLSSERYSQMGILGKMECPQVSWTGPSSIDFPKG